MLENLLQHFFQLHGLKRTYWVAYSGGLDSHVLLHLVVHLRKILDLKLRAIHIHHGISAFADDWQQHCEEVCQRYQVELVTEKVLAKPKVGESLEDCARVKRYEKLATVLNLGDMLLTGQHQDDQAETVMLQLLRGAGPKGLSAMPKIKALGLGLIGRPLLAATREELRVYAEKHGLSWIEDELNYDSHYPRNFLRHEILPLLKSRWATVTTTIARAAKHCAEAQELLVTFGQAQLARLEGSKPNTLSVKQLLELSPPQQRLVIRIWLENQHASLPNTAKLFQIQTSVLNAKQDSNPCVSWSGIEVRRYQGNLYVMPVLRPHDVKQIWEWDGKSALVIPGVGRLEAEMSLGCGLRTGLKMEVKFRQGGEVFRLPNGKHHELKKFFQEKAVPPWDRDRIPLIYMAGELAMVPGFLLVKKFSTKESEQSLGMKWLPKQLSFSSCYSLPP